MGIYLSRLWRFAQQVFHFSIGLTFLGFSFVCGMEAVKEWKIHLEAPGDGVATATFAMFGAFTLVLFSCALYTFLKFRSVR